MLKEIGAEVLEYLWLAGARSFDDLVIEYSSYGMYDIGYWNTTLVMRQLLKSGVSVQKGGAPVDAPGWR